MAEPRKSENFEFGDPLIEENKLRVLLSGFKSGFVMELRETLVSQFPALHEKFHTEQNYIGWWLDGDEESNDADRVYIFFEKDAMSVRIKLTRQREQEIKDLRFDVVPSKNFQGKAGWITGWKIPYDTPLFMASRFFQDALSQD